METKNEVMSFSQEAKQHNMDKWLLLYHLQGLALEGVIAQGWESLASNKKIQMKALVVGQVLRQHMAIKY